MLLLVVCPLVLLQPFQLNCKCKHNKYFNNCKLKLCCECSNWWNLLEGGLNFIFVKIGNEVIQGTITGNTITATSRGLEGTASAHDNGSTVELYQMNGIPLTEINKTHISIGNIGIDSYTVTTNTDTTSSSNQGGASVVATENAMMDGGQTLLPVVQFPDTTVTSSIRTTSATSPSGTETSFDLQGSSFAKSITLGENFFFEKPRQILSTINETNELVGSKSFLLMLICQHKHKHCHQYR